MLYGANKTEVMTMKRSKQGMTLIEIILAFAIIGIMSVALFPVFSSAFSYILRAGDITDADYSTSGQIELALNQGDQGALVQELDITLDGTIYRPYGHIVKGGAMIGDISVSITFFLPKY